MVAVTFVIATLLFSCKDEIPKSDLTVDDIFPSQRVENMNVVQFTKGISSHILEAPLMERYTEVDIPYDAFPEGIMLKAFTPEGLLETKITARYAKHVVKKNEEVWEVNGDVVIINFLKGETVETDTLFWNRITKRIYTHTWVKLTTPELFMQGYGLESDEMARNAVIQNPFDSYAIVHRDSTETLYIDTVNFIGPLLPGIIAE